MLDSTPQVISTDVWHQVLARRSGSQLQVFLDGEAIGSGGAFDLGPSGMPLLIGRRNADDGRDFSVNGRMDEVAIWTRALSDGEITSLYNGGSGMTLSNIPEPASVALLGVASLGLLGCGRRRRQATQA